MGVYTNLLVVANVYTCWIKMIKPFAVLLCLNTAYKPNKNTKYKKIDLTNMNTMNLLVGYSVKVLDYVSR